MTLFAEAASLLLLSSASAAFTHHLLSACSRPSRPAPAVPLRRRTSRNSTVKLLDHKASQEAIRDDNPLMTQLKFIKSPAHNIDVVPHLWLDTGVGPEQCILNPLLAEDSSRKQFQGGNCLPIGSFVYHGAFVLSRAEFCVKEGKVQLRRFLQAGPRRALYFQPREVVAAIVTCGGLCPGLNVVIRELVLTLQYQYQAKKIYGIPYGYMGFYSYDWVELDSIAVRDVQNMGGTILGSSRGGFDAVKMVDALLAKGVNQVYVLGGDGTHRGIAKLCEQLKSRGLGIACVGIPKTIDNDIPLIDSSFGFETSVSEGIRAIQSAAVESSSADYGIGLVRLMGRSCGWIAMNATNAARNVDICLLPEFKFNLFGEKGLLEYVVKRVREKRHLVIVVAEGAGDAINDLVIEGASGTDKSGNKKMPEIGTFLREKIVAYGKEKGVEITLKYIDPTYMIRSVEANAYDKNLCLELAKAAVHGAMAGFTAFTVGHINASVCMIPLTALSEIGTNKIPQDNKAYARMLTQTLQPSFLQ